MNPESITLFVRTVNIYVNKNIKAEKVKPPFISRVYFDWWVSFSYQVKVESVLFFLFFFFPSHDPPRGTPARSCDTRLWRAAGWIRSEILPAHDLCSWSRRRRTCGPGSHRDLDGIQPGPSPPVCVKVTWGRGNLLKHRRTLSLTSLKANAMINSPADRQTDEVSNLVSVSDAFLIICY